MESSLFLCSLYALIVGLAIASHPKPDTTFQSLAAKPAVLIKRYPESNYIRTLNSPQKFCGDIKNLTVVADSDHHNVTIRNCEALREMYAINSSADGNGYWNFTFNTSDQHDISGLPEFTVDFDGDCELKMGLMDYSGTPLIVTIGNTDVYNLINMAISVGNFSSATGQAGCNNGVQVVWAVVWIPGGIGH